MPNMPQLNSYEQAEDWLLAMTDYERMLGSSDLRYDTRAFDMTRFRQQLAALGDPHLKYAAVHVAGTKGKGSTCAMLEAALRSCGYRTGLYTSPHLYRFTERIRINGEPIPDGEFCRLLEIMGARIAAPADKDESASARSFRTVFEILTAAAFQSFADNRVDVAIIETGLGGRLDSTNVFDAPGAGPLVNVITAIGLDHVSILGNTVAEIAREKAGILRHHGRMVLAKQATPEYEADVRRVVSDRQRELDAEHPAVLAAEEIQVEAEPDQLGGRNTYKFRTVKSHNGGTGILEQALRDGLSVNVPLEGEHQRMNAATVLLALRELERGLHDKKLSASKRGLLPELAPMKVASGISSTRWLGRFTVVEAEVPVVVDGAHCVISAAALAKACRDRFGDRPAVIIAGFLRDKAGEAMLREIRGRIPVAHGVALPPPSPRATSGDHILQSLQNVFGSETVVSAASMEEAMNVARHLAQQAGGYVVVFGSLYLVGPALDAAKA